MKLKHLFIPLTGLAVISLASPSYAGDHGPAYDYKTHAGAACQPVQGANSAYFFTGHYIYYSGDGSFLQGGVSCPIVRDSNAVPTKPLDVGVTVQSSSGAQLDCYFRSYDSKGNLIGQLLHYTNNTIPTTMYFAIAPKYIGFDGSYSLGCGLPPGGYVHSYISGEYVNSTDDNN